MDQAMKWLLLLLFVMASTVHADYAAGVAALEKGDFSTAQKELLPLANGGNADAQYAMALMAIKQKPPDFVVAVPWLKAAARGGSDEAQYFLGLLYQRGVGVEQDLGLSDHWLQEAARQGNEDAARLIVTQRLARQSSSRPELEPEPNAPTTKALQPGANYEIEACTSRGIAYFKAIGSYPTLESTGRSADDVARERCNRTTGAY